MRLPLGLPSAAPVGFPQSLSTRVLCRCHSWDSRPKSSLGDALGELCPASGSWFTSWDGSSYAGGRSKRLWLL